VQYAMTVRTGASFTEASARIREALKAQGFGVLTEIDVQSTLREKLGEQRAADDGTIVEALDPRAIAAVADHPELTDIADDAAARLRAALDTLPRA